MTSPREAGGGDFPRLLRNSSTRKSLRACLIIEEKMTHRYRSLSMSELAIYHSVKRVREESARFFYQRIAHASLPLKRPYCRCKTFLTIKQK